MPQTIDPVVAGIGVLPSPAAEPTISSYFDAFAPAPPWERLTAWPPDVFALANLLLDHAEAYRLAVAPPPGRRWPPTADWNQRIEEAGRDWAAAAAANAAAPVAVQVHWDALTPFKDRPIPPLVEAWELWAALLTLHAMADQACAGLAAMQPPSRFERALWDLLAAAGTLCHLSSSRVRVLPKTQFATRGITIRSLSRYLALSYEPVDVRWRRIESLVGRQPVRVAEYNTVIAPWPLEVRASDFRPVPGPLDNMPSESYGFFEFAPRTTLDHQHLAGLLAAAASKASSIDCVILPEGAIDESELAGLEKLLEAHAVTYLVTGVRQPPSGAGLAGNYLHLGVATPEGWYRFRQPKHHRWLLDRAQISQYHLSRVLDPDKLWWEAIELPARKVQVLDVGGGSTMVPLVCEDLARMDEVTDLLLRIGPTLVITVLLDGPQLDMRWSCRYASVLSDEPGSAVLTVTSFGMAVRSQPPGVPRSRAVAMWSDPSTGRHEIELGRGASGILITGSVAAKTVWTADGRCHPAGTPDITLTGVHQLRARRRSGPRHERRRFGHATQNS
jgi:hypothetical protein